MRTFEWAIEDIVAAYPDLGLGDDVAMAVALTMHAPSPCDFLVTIDGFDLSDLEGAKQFVLRLAWNAETAANARRIQRTKQRTPIVEGGAVALAFLLVSHLIPNSEVHLVVRGEGPDYWLPRLHNALEISGTEQVRALPRRIREKRRQLLENWRGWDGYVVVCCFADSHRAIQWNYYSQPE